MTVLFNLLILPAIAVCALPYALCICLPLSLRRRRSVAVFFGKIFVRIARPLLKVRLEGSAQDKIGRRIYVLNHRSFSDTVLCALLPSNNAVCILNTTSSHNPILRWGANRLRWRDVSAMPFDEWKALMLAELEDAATVFCFPEGTRSSKGPPKQFRGGIFRVALEAGLPVYPVVISGSEKSPPRGSCIIRPATIRVKALAPIAANPGESAFAWKTRVRSAMADELKRMESPDDV